LGFDRNTLPGTASSILPITWHPLLSAASSRGRLDWGLIGILCLAERRRSCPSPGSLTSQRHRSGAGWIGVCASIHRRIAIFWDKPSVDGTVRSAATSPRQRVQRNFNVGTIPSLSSTSLIQPTNGRRDRPSSKERVELTGFQAFQGTSFGNRFPVPSFLFPLRAETHQKQYEWHCSLRQQLLFYHPRLHQGGQSQPPARASVYLERRRDFFRPRRPGFSSRPKGGGVDP